MNRIAACNYAAASVVDNKIDLRLAAFLAAMWENKLRYQDVGMSEWWSARCAIGALLGQHGIAEAGFKATVPCGKQGTEKAADADDFADPRYKPTIEVVTEGLRKLSVLRYAQSLPGSSTGSEPIEEQITLPLAR